MKTLSFTLFFVGCCSLSFACDCLMTPITQHIESTPYLITGQALKILDGYTEAGQEWRSFFLNLNNNFDTARIGKSVMFQVEESFKGGLKAGDTIRIGSDYSNCALNFNPGGKYVLFMHKENNVLVTTHCSYSDELNDEKYCKNLMKQIRSVTKK